MKNLIDQYRLLHGFQWTYMYVCLRTLNFLIRFFHVYFTVAEVYLIDCYQNHLRFPQKQSWNSSCFQSKLRDVFKETFSSKRTRTENSGGGASSFSHNSTDVEISLRNFFFRLLPHFVLSHPHFRTLRAKCGAIIFLGGCHPAHPCRIPKAFPSLLVMHSFRPCRSQSRYRSDYCPVPGIVRQNTNELFIVAARRKLQRVRKPEEKKYGGIYHGFALESNERSP